MKFKYIERATQKQLLTGVQQNNCSENFVKFTGNYL